jgi:type VI secretion system protein ImpF
MAEVEPNVQRPVLDRLIDTDPTNATEPSTTWAQSVRELKHAVRRDLEWLLNTRRITEPATEEFPELANSLYNYGLPDITALGAESGEGREWLRRQVEDTIARFEPRLSGVRVSVSGTDAPGRREVRFVVEALLRVEPTPEQVIYDSVLEVTSARFAVTGDDAHA